MDRREFIAAAGTAAALASASQAFAHAGEEPMMHRPNTRSSRKPPRIVSRRAMTA
jgi:hypothetical protein